MLKKIASNTISQILSKWFTAIISIFLIWVLTNYLSAEMYWQYNKIYNYLSIFTFLADLWLYTISIREISKNKENASKIISNVMSLRLLLWLAIIFLSIMIAFFLPWYNSKIILINIFIISVFSVFSLLNSSVLSLMQSFMKMEFSLFSVVFWKLVNFIIILIVCFLLYPKTQITNFNLPFIWIMIAWLIWIIVNFLLNFYYANKIAKIGFWFDFSYMKYLFKTSLPYWVALFLSVVYFKVDVIILSLIEGWEKADLSIALYSLPMKIIEVLMVLAWFFLNSVLPILSNYFKDDKLEEINNLLKNSFKFLFWFSIYILFLWVLFRDNIIKLIATPDYLDRNLHIYTSSDAFLIVLFVLLFYFISAIFNYIFIASKHEKTLLNINIFITIFNIVWNIILIPKFSFIWSAIVTLISQIFLFILWYYYSRKIVKFDIDLFYVLKILLISICLYWLWLYLTINFSISNILDILVYWSLLSSIYLIYFLYINNKLKFKNI